MASKKPVCQYSGTLEQIQSGDLLLVPNLTVSGLTGGSVLFAGAGGAVSQDNPNFFWDDTNNRLGIGIASPAGALHAYGTTPTVLTQATGGNATVALRPSSGASGRLDFQNAAAGTVKAIIASTDGTDALLFFTGGLNERMRIDSGGSVGIGTGSPATKLHLYDASNPVTLLVDSASTNNPTVALAQAGTQYGQFYRDNANGPIYLKSLQTNVPLRLETAGTGPILLNAAGSGKIGIRTATPNQALEVSQGHMRFTPVTNAAAPTVALAGAGAGNLSNGAYKYVVTFVTADGQTSPQNASAAVTVVDNTTNGKVSVTSIPTSAFSQVTSRNLYRTTAGGATYQLLATIADNTTTTFTDNVADASLGAVGPADNTTAGAVFLGTGRVFFFDFSQSLNLAVGGSALVHNTTGTENVAVGYAALDNNTTGSANTAVGMEALVDNTTGSYNTALGFLAMQVNTTGSNNTAVGIEAMLDNTTGVNNTALGYAALQTNTTGTANVAVGLEALDSNATGSGSVAVGTQALFRHTAAAANTAVGNSALYTNTTGTNNTALGYATLELNVTGTDNTAVGYESLLNSTGSGNTAVGSLCLDSNTTASNNTAVGASALTGNTTGTANTAVGYQALQLCVTSTDNTAVGYQAMQSCTAGFNTAVGSSALNALTSGATLTAVGANALLRNTSGSWNTAVGYLALASITANSGSVAVGLQSLLNTTGGSNTAVGTSAGGTTLTTGGNNVLLGNATDTAAAGTNFGVAIGDSAVCASNEAAFGPNVTSISENGPNGQKLAFQYLTELTTIAAAATTATAIQIPANAVVLGVSVRVTVAIPTATTFTVTGNTSATVFDTAAVSVAVNSTDPGTKAGAFYNATAQTIRITPSATPATNAGRVRVTVHYYSIQPATS